MKICTLFTPGSYGTFISWCVYSFSELNTTPDINNPLVFNSAHRYREYSGINIVTPSHIPLDGYTNYILLECDVQNIIGYIDNQFQKQSLGNVETYLKSILPDYRDKLSSYWTTNEAWELRELLSFFLGDLIKNIKEQIDTAHNQVSINKCYLVKPEKFLSSTTELENILNFFGLKQHEKFNLATEYFNKYLSCQLHYNKSHQLGDFINSTINKIPYQLTDATIFDEAYVQHSLRLQGYELKCYGLNRFPSDSIALASLLE